MKNLLLVLMISVYSTSSKSQNFDEWFKQKKTQKKYLVQQIAALQLYIGFVQKGYALAKSGLNTISDIKNGEFNLHDEFFKSLKDVNPSIRNYVKVAGIIDLQIKIMQTCNRTFKRVKESNAFNAEEMSYILRVSGRLTDDCAQITDELVTIITAGKLEMKDDERLKSIERLYGLMQDNYTFCVSFGSETILLAAARMKEKNDVQASRSLNGISNP